MPPPDPKPRAKALVVDDSAFSRHTLRDYLLADGYEVAGMAKDGDEAIFLYEILRPDFVTMDLIMPRRDGLSAIREIRRFDPDAQIVVCSALTDAKTVKDALLSGARDFIVKPYDRARVLEAVSRAAAAREKLAPKSRANVAEITRRTAKPRV